MAPAAELGLVVLAAPLLLPLDAAAVEDALLPLVARADELAPPPRVDELTRADEPVRVDVTTVSRGVPERIAVEGVDVVVVAASADDDGTGVVAKTTLWPASTTPLPSVFRSTYDGAYVAVPVYSGQPGTVDLGGARPPPQSRNAHTSPVPGTYHRRLA